MCAAVCLYAHLTLDDVIVLVDLQDISRVAEDGAAVSIVEVVARATALLCIADPGFLAVNGLTRIMYTTTRHCVWGQGWEGVKEEEQTTEMTKLKKIKNKTNLKIPLLHIFCEYNSTANSETWKQCSKRDKLYIESATSSINDRLTYQINKLHGEKAAIFCNAHESGV